MEQVMLRTITTLATYNERTDSTTINGLELSNDTWIAYDIMLGKWKVEEVLYIDKDLLERFKEEA